MKTEFNWRVEKEEQQRTLYREGEYRRKEHDSEGAGMMGREVVKIRTRQ